MPQKKIGMSFFDEIMLASDVLQKKDITGRSDHGMLEYLASEKWKYFKNMPANIQVWHTNLRENLKSFWIGAKQHNAAQLTAWIGSSLSFVFIYVYIFNVLLYN